MANRVPIILLDDRCTAALVAGMQLMGYGGRVLIESSAAKQKDD